MNVLITLFAAGTDTGPFNLFSNVDNYTTAFQSNVSKSALINGLMVTTVPDTAVIIRVKSNSVNCTNSIDLVIAGVPPVSTTTTTTSLYIGPSTTTSTSTSSTSTSTTSTSTTARPLTTTSTTTAPLVNHPFAFELTDGFDLDTLACEDYFPAVTVWGDNPLFLANTRFFAFQNSNAFFNGSGFYYGNITTGQYVQIAANGINLGGGTC
jgi:hypothetical protein